MPKDTTLEAHATAPRSVRELQKYYQKLHVEHIPITAQILDLRDLNSQSIDGSISIVQKISPDALAEIYGKFLGDEVVDATLLEEVNVYEHTSLPGLRIIPSLLSIPVQESLLSKLLLRDLSNKEHLTNVHLHYNVPYPDSNKTFFDLPRSTSFMPKDPDIHKPLGIVDVLEKKLRWMTLGGQYDWTTKEYPNGPPVQFPKDIRDLVHDIFPTVEPEAAICNTYSPGDTLSTHRDVSEEADRDLISISVGCDALFLISLSADSHDDNVVSPSTASDLKPNVQPRKLNKKKGKELPPPPPPPPLDDHTLIIRIRSGDAVVMGGQSRWAWHGVPKVIGDTCPEELTEWPNLCRQNSDNVDKIDWTGWMKRKRVNLNIRQMYEHSNSN